MSRTARAVRWTPTKPTKAGWYWWRLEKGFPEEIAYIQIDKNEPYELLHDGSRASLVRGEWQPVPAPRE